MNFLVFTNDRKDVVYRKYVGKDADGKAAFEECQADYCLTNNKAGLTGSAINGVSRAGNPVIRLRFRVNGAVYYGTLNFTKRENKAPKAPDMFGTVSTKHGEEKAVSCWVREDRNGRKHMSCVMQEPFKKPQAAEPETDDIPF